MSIDDRVRAPTGKYAVFEWDPSNPEKSTPRMTAFMRTGKPAIFYVEALADNYARRRNESWYKARQADRAAGKPCIGEVDYFVVNDQGLRMR